MAVVDNYLKIKENIANIAYRCGRNPLDIELIAVSKGHSDQDCLPLYRSGVRDFGESRWQEAEKKITALPEDIRWHFIGHLQQNKVKKAVSACHLIHSVDRLELAQKISQIALELEETISILIQVNTSGEESKQGFTISTFLTSFDSLLSLPALRIEGLMTMAPADAEEKRVRQTFAKLWDLRDRLLISFGGTLSLPHLSMGMSNDYPWAIEEGATLLRIGSALFA